MKELYPMRGVITTVNTPFNEDLTINWSDLRRTAEAALEAGVSGFLAPCFASEIDELTNEERYRMVTELLDVTHQAYITREEYRALRTYRNPVADFIADLFDFFSKSCIEERGHPGCLVHDACAVAGLIDPTLYRYVETSAQMDLDGGLTRGGCVIDVRPEGWPRREPVNARVATWVDRPRFVQLLLDSCASYSKTGEGGSHEA